MTNRLINPSIGAGYSDGESAEIIANVVLNIFTDYINCIAQIEIDFPKVSFSGTK